MTDEWDGLFKALEVGFIVGVAIGGILLAVVVVLAVVA